MLKSFWIWRLPLLLFKSRPYPFPCDRIPHTHKKGKKKNLNGLILHWSLLLGRLLSEATDSEVSVVPTVSCMSGKQLCWSYQHLFTGSGDALLWTGIKRIQRNKQALFHACITLLHIGPFLFIRLFSERQEGKRKGWRESSSLQYLSGLRVTFGNRNLPPNAAWQGQSQVSPDAKSEEWCSTFWCSETQSYITKVWAR